MFNIFLIFLSFDLIPQAVADPPVFSNQDQCPRLVLPLHANQFRKLVQFKAGEYLYRGIHDLVSVGSGELLPPITDQEIRTWFSISNSRFSSGRARSQGLSHSAEIARYAQQLVEGSEDRQLLADELAGHANGITASNSPWVSTSSDYSIAAKFSHGQFLVRIRAPENAIVMDLARKNSPTPNVYGGNYSESEVLIPGVILPEWIQEVTELKVQGEKMFAIRRWYRSSNGSISVQKIRPPKLIEVSP